AHARNGRADDPWGVAARRIECSDDPDDGAARPRDRRPRDGARCRCHSRKTVFRSAAPGTNSRARQIEPMTVLGRANIGIEPAAADGPATLPSALLPYVITTSWMHQLPLLALTVTVFLLEVVPLELQRRIVNDVVKHRQYSAIVLLCAAYAAAVMVQGSVKLA